MQNSHNPHTASEDSRFNVIGDCVIVLLFSSFSIELT